MEAVERCVVAKRRVCEVVRGRLKEGGRSEVGNKGVGGTGHTG